MTDLIFLLISGSGWAEEMRRRYPLELAPKREPPPGLRHPRQAQDATQAPGVEVPRVPRRPRAPQARSDERGGARRGEAQGEDEGAGSQARPRGDGAKQAVPARPESREEAGMTRRRSTRTTKASKGGLAVKRRPPVKADRTMRCPKPPAQVLRLEVAK